MSGRWLCYAFLAFVLLPTAPVRAATWTVYPDGSGDAPTIAAAIDSLSTGDVIELGDGVFTGDGNRDLYNMEKGFVLRSQSNNPEACIIDCQGSAAEPHWGISFSGGG